MKENMIIKYRGILLILALVVGYYFFGGFPAESSVENPRGLPQIGLMEKAVAPLYMREEIAPRYAAEMTRSNAEASGQEDRRLQKTASVSLETEKEKYDDAKKALEQTPAKYTGYYTDQNERRETYGEKEYRVFSMTLKVPVDQFDTVVADVKTIAQLQSMSMNVYDMTTQYQDTKVYLENYKKERAKLEQLYDRAEKIEDVIRVQDRLTQVQVQIDSYEAQLRNLERTTDYASIYVSLSEKKEIIESYFEMTGIMVLLKNIVLSFDTVFVFLSNILGWAIFGLLGWGIYRWVVRKRK